MRLYFIFVCVVVVALAYWCGARVALHKCRADVAVANVVNFKYMGEINAVVNNTGVGDIRRVLREQYTIAD